MTCWAPIPTRGSAAGRSGGLIDHPVTPLRPAARRPSRRKLRDGSLLFAGLQLFLPSPGIAQSGGGGEAGRAPGVDLLGGMGAFSTVPPGSPLPPGWQPVSLERGLTHYAVEADAVRVACLAARSAASASLLHLGLEGEAASGRVLQWSWRSASPVGSADLTRPEGDDAPARITVGFDFTPPGIPRMDRLRHRLAQRRMGQALPGAAISYIWGNGEPVGTEMRSPYSDRVWLVVVRSAGDATGEWLRESRDVHDDFRRLFGADPPSLVGLALLTDSDDTGTESAACYGDIQLH